MAYTYQYMTSAPRSPIRRSDAYEFPQDPSNKAYCEWVDFMALGGETAAADAPTLEARQQAGEHTLDSQASDARTSWAQRLGDDDIYRWLRFREAQAFDVAVAPNDEDYPMLGAEVPWNGADVDEVHDVVLAELAELKRGMAEIGDELDERQAGIVVAASADEVDVLVGEANFPIFESIGIGVLHLTIEPLEPTVTVEEP